MEYEKQLETAFNSLMNKNKGDIVPINYDIDHSSRYKQQIVFLHKKNIVLSLSQIIILLNVNLIIQCVI
ncbi:hypothetical protein AB6G21_08470 [Providencia hangzhouensis]|uniref:hypothetical protein n=1 Tax=Providencia hangzhouensis TaxID=3031799 RepID=UPI0034DD2119